MQATETDHLIVYKKTGENLRPATAAQAKNCDQREQSFGYS